MFFHKTSILSLIFLVCITLYGCGPSKADERRWQEAGWVSGKITSSKVLADHNHIIKTVGFSPDGSRVITREHDGPLRLWDAASGKYIATFKWFTPIYGIVNLSYAFSPDGKTVLTRPHYSGAGIWDANDGQLLATLKNPCYPPYSSLSRLQFSPDGAHIIAKTGYNKILIFDAKTSDVLLSLNHTSKSCKTSLEERDRGPISKMVYSPDGTRITTWSRDAMVRIWDATNGRLISAIESKMVNSRYTAVLSHNGAIIVAETHPLQYPQPPRAPHPEIGEIIPMQDAIKASKERAKKQLAKKPVIDRNEDVSVAKQQIQGVKRGHPQYKPGKNASSKIQLWNAVNGQYIALLEHAKNSHYAPSHAKFSPDDSRLIINDWRNRQAKFWDARTGEYLLTLNGRFTMYEFSPNGNRIVTGSEDKTARIWDVKDGKLLAVMKGHRKRVMSARFSRDGTRILTGSLDKTNRLWDAQNGMLLATFNVDGGWGRGKHYLAHFSHDGTRIATIRRKNVTIWDAITGQRIAVLEGHKSRVTTVKFSPDDTRLVTGSRDNTARIWNLTRANNK